MPPLLRRLLRLQDSFDVCRLLSSGSQLAGWQASGLPPDALSAQNGVVISQTELSPLVVDHSYQVGGSTVSRRIGRLLGGCNLAPAQVAMSEQSDGTYSNA